VTRVAGARMRHWASRELWALCSILGDRCHSQNKLLAEGTKNTHEEDSGTLTLPWPGRNLEKRGRRNQNARKNSSRMPPDKELPTNRGEGGGTWP